MLTLLSAGQGVGGWAGDDPLLLVQGYNSALCLRTVDENLVTSSSRYKRLVENTVFKLGNRIDNEKSRVYKRREECMLGEKSLLPRTNFASSLKYGLQSNFMRGRGSLQEQG